MNRLRHFNELESDARRRRAEELRKRIATTIDAITDGFRSEGLKERLEAMETELGELEAQLNNAKAPLPRMHPNLAQLYRRQAERLEAALQDASTRDEALTLVRSLIGHVAVHVRDEGFEIELEGEIAMSVDANNDKAALHGRLLDDGTRCSIKVVAEA